MSVCKLFDEPESSQYLVTVSVNSDTEWDERYVVKIGAMAAKKIYCCLKCFHSNSTLSASDSASIDCTHFSFSSLDAENQQLLNDVQPSTSVVNSVNETANFDKSVCELNLTLSKKVDISTVVFKSSIINNLFRFLALKNINSPNSPQYGGEIAEMLMAQICVDNGIKYLKDIDIGNADSLCVYVETPKKLEVAEYVAFQCIKYEQKKSNQLTKLSACKLKSENEKCKTNILYCLNDKPFLNIKFICPQNSTNRLTKGIGCSFKPKGSPVSVAIYFVSNVSRFISLLSSGYREPSLLQDIQKFIESNGNNHLIDPWEFTMLINLFHESCSRAKALPLNNASDVIQPKDEHRGSKRVRSSACSFESLVEHLITKRNILLRFSSLSRNNATVIEIQMKVREAFYTLDGISLGGMKSKKSQHISAAAREYQKKSLTRGALTKLEDKKIEELFQEKFGGSIKDEELCRHQQEVMLFVEGVCPDAAEMCGELFLFEKQGFLRKGEADQIPYMGKLCFSYSLRNSSKSQPQYGEKRAITKVGLDRYENIANYNYLIADTILREVNGETGSDETKRLHACEIISTSILKYMYYSIDCKSRLECFRTLLHLVSSSVHILSIESQSELTQANTESWRLLVHTYFTMLSTSIFKTEKHSPELIENIIMALVNCLERGLYSQEFEICCSVVSLLPHLKKCIDVDDKNEAQENLIKLIVLFLGTLQTAINHDYLGSPEHYNSAVILLELVGDFSQGGINVNEEQQKTIENSTLTAKKVVKEATNKKQKIESEIKAHDKKQEERFALLEKQRAMSDGKLTELENCHEVERETEPCSSELTSEQSGVSLLSASASSKENALSAWEVELNKAILLYRKGDTQNGEKHRNSALKQATTDLERAQIWTDVTSAGMYSSRQIIRRACYLGRKCNKFSDEMMRVFEKAIKEIPDQTQKAIDIQSSKEWLKVNPLVETDELLFFSSQFNNFSELKSVSCVISKSIAGYQKALKYLTADLSNHLPLGKLLLKTMAFDLSELNELEGLIRGAKGNLLAAMDNRLKVIKWLGLYRPTSIKTNFQVQSELSKERKRLFESTEDLSIILPVQQVVSLNLNQLIGEINQAEKEYRAD